MFLRHVMGKLGVSNHLYVHFFYGKVLQEPPPNCLPSDIFYFAPNDKKQFYLTEVEDMLRKGANVNIKNHKGDTPLSQAAWQNFPEMVRLLVQFGADRTCVNDLELTPLDVGLIAGADPEVLDLLMDPRLELTGLRFFRCVNELVSIDLLEVTDQRTVGEDRRLRMVLFCLDRGASIDQRFNKSEDTILHLLSRINVGFKTIDQLLARGADINARNRYGLMALHLCARYQNSPDKLKQLLDRGANLEAVSDSGTTILHFAACNREPDMLRAVLKFWRPRPVDVICGPESRDLPFNYDLSMPRGTPLHIAVRVGCRESVRILLAAGANIDAYDRRGWSVLQIAIHECMALRISKRNCIKFLLERGADLNAYGPPPDRKPLPKSTPDNGICRALVRQLALWELGDQLSEEPDLSKDYYVSHRKYHGSCLAELRRMQTVRLCPEATLFELLALVQLPSKPGALKTLSQLQATSRTRPISWLEDPKLIEALDRSCSHTDIPIYAESLERSLATARERCQLHHRALNGLRRLFGHLPLVPADMIVGQLCPADQMSLADFALPPPGASSTNNLETSRLELSRLSKLAGALPAKKEEEK